MTKQANFRIHATETSFEIIEAIREQRSTGVTELADHLGVAKSTVHNHLMTLTDLGYLVREDGEYRLSLRFLSLGDHARHRYDLYDASRQELESLVDRVGERGQVMVAEDTTGFYLYQIKSDQGIQTDSHVGTEVKLHATAVGKSYLSHLPEEEVAELLDRMELSELTDNTLTERDLLFEELQEVREKGFAVNNEERIIGMCAVGAPIISDSGTVLGAISVSGPTTRMSGEWYHEEVPQMTMKAARVIGIKATYE